MAKNDKEIMQRYAYSEVAPVMVEYTKWILQECKERNIKKVYFLARDGFLLWKLAQEICKANNLNIDCRYLYCSRFSLRMPTYHLIGEEKYKLLFLKGYYYTPRSVLERAGLTYEERKILFEELKIVNEDAVLSDKEFDNLTKLLKENKYFNKIIEKNSKNAYKNTIQYFKEQGLFDDKNIVIADSGWTGSMQRSLRQLVTSAGYKGNIIGFYFGLTTLQKAEDGEYLAYYFNHNKGRKRKIMFNNNLFECMLSANHGMTIGYEKTEQGMKPIMKSLDNENMLELINLQIEMVSKYAKENQVELQLDRFNLKQSLKKSYKHLKRVMVYPKQEEVGMLSGFMFCDDVTEGYHMSLADKNMTQALKSNMILPRVFRKLFGKKNTHAANLFWPYGVIAYQPKILRPWYRLNLKIWDMIRLTIRKK